MTTVGIVGMGRMGQAIARVLESRPGIRYHPFQRISPDNEALFQQCDVVIEFTTPEAAPGVIRHCIEKQKPVISGTTGWHEYHLPSILAFCRDRHGTLLYATNFSIGMNIMFSLNRKLASVMTAFPDFKPSIHEVHHVHKKDAPSGTAYTLIEDLVSAHSGYTGFTLETGLPDVAPDLIPVTAVREGEVKGIHEVSWTSGMETLQLKHEAHDRRIFAEGAVHAATWLVGHPPGIYTMRDIIHF